MIFCGVFSGNGRDYGGEACISNSKGVSNNLNSNRMHDVVTRLVKQECGHQKFVGIKNAFEDGFIVLLLESNVILPVLTDKINHKYHIMLGTPEDTPHECPKHLLGLLNKYNVPGYMCAVVEGLIKIKHISEAVDATKLILKSRKLFFHLMSLLLSECLVLFHVFKYGRWYNS